MQTDITVLDRLMVVNLDAHIWSARRKLDPHDLGNAELPPEELASLGSKKVCNPEELNIFRTLKARAESMLRQTGVRFLCGWAIPDEKLVEIDSALAVIRDDFNNAKEDFLKRYEQTVQDWIASHPAWGEIIANSVVREDYVRSKLDFHWQIYRVATPQTNEPLQDHLVNDVQNLGETLYDEIAKSATETWKNCYEGKAEVTRKALSPLKSMYDKLMGLTFIEPRVSPIASLINTALKSIPQRGPITGATLLMLQGLVSMLRMPQEIVNHGQKILDGQDAGDVLSGICNMLPPDLNLCPEDDGRMPVLVQTPKAPELESCGLW